MRKMKSRKEEQQLNLAHLLNRAGCPVQMDTGFHAPPTGLVIEQVPEVGLNTVFDLANGGTGFVLDVLIKNERHDPVWLEGFQIESPWGHVVTSLVAAPKKWDARYPYYCFPDDSGPAFDGTIVVNRFFTTRRRLNRNDEICGLLMALNTDSIPDEVEHNARALVTFSVFDRRGTRFSKNFRLAVDRTERMIPERKGQLHIEPRHRESPLGSPDYVAAPENKQPKRINNNDALRWFIETMEGLNKKPM
jgi:hypothetical protein